MGSKLSLTENRLNPFFLICISLICLLDMYANFICLFIHECIKEHDIYICSSIFYALNSLFCKLLFIIN